MVIIPAPSKLTLTLRMTGVRDDGFHLIDAEMVALQLCDLLTIEPGHDGLRATGPFASGIPLDSSNLVNRALILSGRRASVVLDKRIPHGGGLGGGSADAAAILRWAGYTDLLEASRLGADIPFCMVGGRARVRGIGEIVEPLPAVDEDVTLIIPPLSCSTPAVYRAWDEMGGPRGDSGNDLEPAAMRVEPRLIEWRSRISEVVGTAPTLAGSGATWFLRGSHPELTKALPDATVIVTRTDRR